MKSETPKEKIIHHFSIIKQPTDSKIDTRFFNAELPDLKKDAKNTKPPNYALKHIFLHILVYPNLGPSEKINWICKFEYKTKPFVIYDYKFDTWTLVGDKSLINEVKDIFEKAAELCDEYFLDTFKISLEKRECYLHNNYLFLKRGYDFFRSEIEKKIDEIKNSQQFKIKSIKISKNSLVEEITNYHEKLRADISYLTFGLISSFFSLTELIMEVVYIFQFPDEDPLMFNSSDFNKKILSWFAKFRKTFDLGNKDFENYLNELGELKNQLRNPLEHGMNSIKNLLYPLDNEYLVPFQINYLDDEIYFQSIPIDETDYSKIVTTFEYFFELLQKTPPYSYYLLLIESHFPIPLEINRIKKYKDKMVSIDEFKGYLNWLSEMDDIKINREY